MIESMSSFNTGRDVKRRSVVRENGGEEGNHSL